MLRTICSTFSQAWAVRAHFALALWSAAVFRRFSGKFLPRHIVKKITQAVRTASQEINFFARLRIHIDKFSYGEPRLRIRSG